MQNLQPISDGVVVDGVALAQRLINKIGGGGVEVAGDAENILIKFRQGVEIDGFAAVTHIQNYVFTGGVVVDGAAFEELGKEFKKKISFLPGDTVFLAASPTPYTIQGFYYDLDDKIRYEIANPNRQAEFVYEQDLARTNESYVVCQLNRANQMIEALSL